MVVADRPAPAAHRRTGAGVKDVAARAGVSLGTVSNVLNRPEQVSRPTRERVLTAIEQLGFVRNDSARQLRAGTSRVLAYVVLDAGNPFFTDVARGVEDAAEGAGLAVVLCNSDGRAEREAGYLQLLEQQHVQGVLITPVDATSGLAESLAARGTPVVLVDRTNLTGALCSVSVDDVLGGRLAATHLLELGHRRIAFVGGPSTLGQIRDRHAGVAQAVRSAGLPDSTVVDIDTRSMSVAEGRAAGERLIGLPRPSRPTAAICANDLLALGLLQHAVAAGRSVPGDLAIVGYDDIEFAGAAAVPLTSVRQPRRQLGQRSTELLLDESADPDHQHQQVLLTPELVVRASTAGTPVRRSRRQAKSVGSKNGGGFSTGSGRGTVHT